MDTKTLITAALVVAVATSLSMAIVFWTRRTYPGFGYWLAGWSCRMVSGVLFLLPRGNYSGTPRPEISLRLLEARLRR